MSTCKFNITEGEKSPSRNILISSSSPNPLSKWCIYSRYLLDWGFLFCGWSPGKYQGTDVSELNTTNQIEQNHLIIFVFLTKKKQFPGSIFKMKHLFFCVPAGTYGGRDCSRDILQISKKQRQNEEPSASRVLQQQSEQPRMRSVWRWPSLYYNSAPSSGETSFQEPPSLQDYVVAKRPLVKTRL